MTYSANPNVQMREQHRRQQEVWERSQTRGTPDAAHTRSVRGHQEYHKKGTVSTHKNDKKFLTRHPHKGSDQKAEIPDVVSTWLEHTDEENMRDESGTHYYQSHKLGRYDKLNLELLLQHCYYHDGFTLDEAMYFRSSDNSHKKMYAWKGRLSSGKLVDGIVKQL